MSVDICHNMIRGLQIEEKGKEFMASHFCFVRKQHCKFPNVFVPGRIGRSRFVRDQDITWQDHVS